jgi:hypothetical protein
MRPTGIVTKADEVAWLRAEHGRIEDAALEDVRKLLRAAAATADMPPASEAVRAQVVRLSVLRLFEADRDLVALDASLIARGAAA